MAKLPMIILYVADQKRSAQFYGKILGKNPLLDVPGMTEFEISDRFLLGLMPENGIAKILGDKTEPPSSGNGIPRCELYLITEKPEQALQHALEAGAKEISRAELRSWGDTVAYCSDPDGHIIAFAR
jgi:uncharacterized glyoxalase superfamily protein PhnB